MKPFNLSQYMLTLSQAAGAGLVGYNASNSYPAGSVGAAIKANAALIPPTMTPGSVAFAGASGVLTQDNANFFWDTASHRLSLGTTTNSARLTVNTDISIVAPTVADYATLYYDGYRDYVLQSVPASDSGGGFRIVDTTAPWEHIRFASNLNVGVGYSTPRPGTSRLQVNGDVSIWGTQPACMFNTYYNAGWKAQAVGYTGAIKVDTVNGGLQFNCSLTSASAADGVSDNRYVGGFGKDGCFNVGTIGGDYGDPSWIGLFRRDNNTLTSFGVVNNNAGVNASALIRLITGTGNSFVNFGLVDNAGAPYVYETLGDVINYRYWNINNGSLTLKQGGLFGINQSDPRHALDVNGDMTIKDLGWLHCARNGATYTGSIRAGIQFDGAGQRLIVATNNTVCAAWYPDGVLNINRGGLKVNQAGGGGISLIPGDSTHSGYVQFRKVDDSAIAYIGYIPDGGGDLVISNQVGGIRSDSNFVINNNNLWLGGYIALSGSAIFKQYGGTCIQTWTPDNNYNAMVMNHLGAISGTIWVTNTATSYNSASDERLKTNILDAVEDAGKIIDAMRVRQFDWKSDGAHVRLGFIAQEVQLLYPEAVTPPTGEAELDVWMMDNSKMVPLLLKEMQALRARVAELEAKVP